MALGSPKEGEEREEGEEGRAAERRGAIAAHRTALGA